MIYWDIVQETDGSTGSPFKFAELEMSNEDKLELERNNKGDKVTNTSDIMFNFSQLTDAGTANAVDDIPLTNDVDGKRVGTNGIEH